MFWALAGVTFSAAKIVSCNKNFFFHGLPSTLLQLFYFREQTVIKTTGSQHSAFNRVGTGCAMDYAGKYTVDVFNYIPFGDVVIRLTKKP
jgi:hypothetical protein